jgi:hypothetical protein
MTPHSPLSDFKMTRNSGGTTAWVRGELSLLLQNDRLFVIHGQTLNVRIGEGRVEFMAGAPSDLKRALLALTDEYETIALAGITADGVA